MTPSLVVWLVVIVAAEGITTWRWGHGDIAVETWLAWTVANVQFIARKVGV